MIKIENFCKPNATKLLGIKGAFDEEIEGELKPCPLCGRIPKPKKAYVERIREWLELYSYGTKICSYNPFTKEFLKTWAYNYSRTTKRHQKAFFEKYGIQVLETRS